MRERTKFKRFDGLFDGIQNLLVRDEGVASRNYGERLPRILADNCPPLREFSIALLASVIQWLYTNGEIGWVTALDGLIEGV